MVIQTIETTPHWAYFISLESGLAALSRYVEFDERNFECFSIEIVKLLLSASAEVEVVCKQLCEILSRYPSKKGMRGYRNEIVDAYPNLPEFRVLLPRFGLTLTPWTEWKAEDRPPIWWKGYDNVKHHRHTHYEHANLKNVLNAVAGLFLVVLHLYREAAVSGDLSPRAELFTTEEAGAGPNGSSYWIPNPAAAKISL